VLFGAERRDPAPFRSTYQRPRMRPATPPRLSTTFEARVHRHDDGLGLSTLQFGDGELRVPMVAAPVGTALALEIDARDVSVALSRPMDVSITNRLPGTIVAVERLAAPYARVDFDLGTTRLSALVTWESVDRLALEPGVRAWAMIKTVAIGGESIRTAAATRPRPWPPE
jgi:molybdate transport system ATP-binding protein